MVIPIISRKTEIIENKNIKQIFNLSFLLNTNKILLAAHYVQFLNTIYNILLIANK